jgi:hypothetical protein
MFRIAIRMILSQGVKSDFVSLFPPWGRKILQILLLRVDHQDLPYASLGSNVSRVQCGGSISGQWATTICLHSEVLNG